MNEAGFPRRGHRGIPGCVLLMGLALLALPASALAVEFEPEVAITDNGVDDVAPEIWGEDLVWQERPDAQGGGILLKRGDLPPARLNNTGITPEVSEGNVVWVDWVGRPNTADLDRELFLFDGSSVVLPNPNAFDDERPRISGANLAWLAREGADLEVFARIDGITVRLTDNDFSDFGVEILGERVVWSGFDGDDTEIFLFDGTDLRERLAAGGKIEDAIVQISDNQTDDEDPEISDRLVTWTRFPAGPGDDDREILVWDGTTVVNLSDNDVDDVRAVVSGSHVVWGGQGTERADLELFHWDGQQIRQLTHNDFDEVPAQIRGTQLVWAASPAGEGNEIFFYDLASGEPCCTQLTHNDEDDSSPRVFGGTVVWSGEDRSALSDDREIFMAVPEPSAGAGLAALGVALGAHAILLLRRPPS